MSFPPLGIPTLAPVLRQRGHQVQMFDTCHPQMEAEQIVEAVAAERPDVIALSFLATTTYPAAKTMARRLKVEAPRIPIIVGGAFATGNSDRILNDCPDIDCVGVGEGEELLPDCVEAGTQEVLDRLRKDQTLARIENTVKPAKQHGIEMVHGFFVIGSPGESAVDKELQMQGCLSELPWGLPPS